MNKGKDIRLIYEWNTRRAKLDYAIKECEFQLASCKKRLDTLHHDLKLYIAFLVVPVVLLNILEPVVNLLYKYLSFGNMLTGLGIDIFNKTLFCLYVVLFPFNLYSLIKTILLLNLNKEPENKEITPPPILGSLRGYKAPQEPSFRSEHDKLIYVLTRYYLSADTMDELFKKINSPDCTMSLFALKMELDKIPFYEDISPADTFSGDMSKKTHRKTMLILIGIAVLIIMNYFF